MTSDHPYHVEGLTCMSINAESTVAVTGSTDSSVCIVNIQNGKVHTTALQSAVTALQGNRS